MSLVDQACSLARDCLASELPRRWLHVRAVAAKAQRVALVLDPPDREVLVAAAWLHDVGYASDIVASGFHPLDGARWLAERGFHPRVTALVAHHSCAIIEADERGLADQLSREFPREQSPTADALWYCDMTTGPDGRDLQVQDRLAEAMSRYGPGHVVTRFLDRAAREIVRAVDRTEQRLDALSDAQPT
jgi:putative nucleotidyltransferase with HDIG domain